MLEMKPNVSNKRFVCSRFKMINIKPKAMSKVAMMIYAWRGHTQVCVFVCVCVLFNGMVWCFNSI